MMRDEPIEPDPAPAGGSQIRLWGKSTMLSLGITVAVLVALALNVDFAEISRELAGCNFLLAALGLCAHYVTYPVRGMRWRRALRQLQVQAGNGKFGLLVFFYNFVDNIVPAKLGDVYGAHLAKINLGVKRSAALGSIVFLRMIDAWILLVLAAVSSSYVFAQHLPETVIWALVLGGLVAVATTVIILLFRVYGHRLPGPWSAEVKRIAGAFRTGMWPKRSQYEGILVLTLLIWALEGSWILCLALSFGIPLDAMQLVFLTTIPLLASATPITPSGAGLVELTMYGCLRAIGIASPLAVSLTFLNRVIDYWLHIGLGLLAWAARKQLGLQTWREVPVDGSELTPEDTSVRRRTGRKRKVAG